MLGQAVLPVAPLLRQPLLVEGLIAPLRVTFPTSRGQCRPLGATPLPGGVNFAVVSRHAQAVSLVLFREGQEEPTLEISLDPVRNKTGDVWHVFVHDLPLDYLYGYRVQGPNAPRAGHRFNSRAVVFDPYARALSGGQRWGVRDLALGTGNGNGHPGIPLSRRARIAQDDFDWEDDRPPATPLSQSVIYELHVRGFTRHPSAGVVYPGTYLGLCEKIPYLKALGVTAVQLMPVMEFDEFDQTHRNPATGEVLKNYWGYSTLAFFAPKAGYAAQPGQQAREFKEMVKAFHRAGLEVILDVVFNHTSEGNEQGPTLSFRGLDNALYYMLDREGRYYNYTGCGNTLNCNHPVVRDLILDSLTHWVTEYRVDGFRFDLAAILGRGAHGKVLEEPALLYHIAEHPILSGVKLLAEPWDAGGLSLLGKFPNWGRWLEFNGWFRDDARRFIRGDAGATAPIAKRICGSLDMYGEFLGTPYHSLNFVTCHDGFTLHDLVSYNHKHNWANGENNRDGWHDSLSSNYGHEGPTDNPHVQAVRSRQVRNFLTLMFISQGVPFLSQGDEFGRTQQGNNNAYCQDNEVSWVDWDLAEKNADLVRFTRLLITLRKKHFALGRDQFVNRVSWHGTKPGDPDWTGQRRTLAFQLHGAHGQPDLLVLFNAHWEWQRFNLPPHHGHQWRWKRLADTNLAPPEDLVEEKDAVPLQPSDHYNAAPRSAVILISS